MHRPEEDDQQHADLQRWASEQHWHDGPTQFVEDLGFAVSALVVVAGVVAGFFVAWSYFQ